MDGRRLVELREKVKARKPEFLRYEWWKKAKFKNDPAWRKPKGIDNKARLKLKGYPPMPTVGYGGPAKARGLHPSGLVPVVVHNPKELEGLDPKKHIIYIGGDVGLRKALELVQLATSKGFKIANPPKAGG